MRLFRERLSIVCVHLSPFGFEEGMVDLIVLVPDHCISVKFSCGSVHACFILMQ